MSTVIAVLIAAIVLAGLAFLLFSDTMKGRRTQIFAWLTMAFGGVAPLLGDVFTYLQSLDWRQYFDPSHAPWIILGIGVMTLVLRYVTTGPIGTGK